jgi:hypothetical protein
MLSGNGVYDHNNLLGFIVNCYAPNRCITPTHSYNTQRFKSISGLICMHGYNTNELIPIIPQNIIQRNVAKQSRKRLSPSATSNMLNFDDFIHTDARIVDGYRANHNQFPFMVSLEYLNKHSCGASIISKKHCLSAAHCYYDRQSPQLFQIRAGTIYSSGNNGILHAVKQLIIHEKFEHINGYPVNDIGIVVLSSDLHLDYTRINVIPLPNYYSNVPVGQNGTVMGWYVNF